MKCCICGREIEGYGNNPAPVIIDGDARCCDECNMNVVIPIRIIQNNYCSRKKLEEESK